MFVILALQLKYKVRYFLQNVLTNELSGNMIHKQTVLSTVLDLQFAQNVSLDDSCFV